MAPTLAQQNYFGSAALLIALNISVTPGVADKDMAAMELGLAHSLSRYKLKFSPDKIDTMIVQVGWVHPSPLPI